jgi:two-component system sensor histidine kinase VanS
MPAAERAPGLSVRVKLTLSYAGFLLVAGVAMVAVAVFTTWRFVPDGNLTLLNGMWVPNRTNLLEVVYKYSGWALTGLLVFGLAGGWVLAGLVLRPLRRITDAAARARDGDWDGRIALAGRNDELTDLADTFDALLDRVQKTIRAERRFAANASHELRTPLTIVRTLVEVAQTGDGHDIPRTLARIGETNDRAIGLTEALLDLARAESGRGLRRERVDLADAGAAAVADAAEEAATRRIRIDTDLRPSAATADPGLIARLVENLVRNAVRHNLPGGRVLVATTATDEHAALAVVNTGESISADEAATHVEPFVRGAGRARRADGPPGSGLGLALVDAIVRTHGGVLQVSPREGGGLHVRALLPR